MRKAIVLGVCVGIMMTGTAWGYFSAPARGEALSPAALTEGRMITVVRPSVTTSALFVGDVMLARHVEKRTKEHALDYPFTRTVGFLKSHTAVVGNFEGAVPKTHVPAPAMTFAFSVDRSFLPELRSAGFTHLGLANNHSYDFGGDAYLHTKKKLRDAGFFAGGDQTQIAKDDILLTRVGDLSVAVVPVYAVFTTPARVVVATAFARAASSSDVQIAYIHWGDEYQLQHSFAQEQLAHVLIDAGADAVIGHHPHVVQDIGMYKNAPIFYSLGNFIFDQYWNKEVQTGLAVELRADGDALVYALSPLRSEVSVPHFLAGAEKQAFLTQLARRSGRTLAPAIEKGELILKSEFLASLPK